MLIFQFIIKLILIIYMPDFVKIPCYSLSPDKITLYERIEWTSFSEKQLKGFENLKNNKSKYNEISENGRKRLLTALNYMLYLSKEKEIIGNRKLSKQIANEIQIEKGKKYNKKVKYTLTFITLTLSSEQKHEDKEITKRLLGSFLDSLRRKWKVTQYIWKAEKQENGNIHYHIITNKFIHWQEVRDVWNRIQNKDGFNYVDAYSNKMKEFFKDGFKMYPGDKRSKETQLKAYTEAKKSGWMNPNSTDIHALYKVKNIASYITKYVSKPVTKTSRIKKIDFLIDSIDKANREVKFLEEQNSKIIFDYQNLYNPDNVTFQENSNRIVELKTKLPLFEKELEELKNKGVTGRIWGQSQTLSKIKSYTDVENPRDIPDIEKVEKVKRYVSEVEVGKDNRVITYYFDIRKTPQLKQILDTHISRSINGAYLLDKLEFDKHESEFKKQKKILVPKTEIIQQKLAV